MRQMHYPSMAQIYSLLLSFFLLIVGLFIPDVGYNQNCNRNAFRSIDGTCNNMSDADWGAADIPLLREMPAAYAPSNPFGDMITNRPNPRTISNTLFNQIGSIENESNLSSFVFSWGQFIDHDMDITTTGDESADIPMPSDETDLTNVMSFNRSSIVAGTGIASPRQQTNLITSWIDASQVYGSDEERARWLRTFKNGKLKVSAGNLLPYNTYNGEASGTIDPHAPEMDNPITSGGLFFVAGDIRANEQPGLTALHTLFVREHNRICDKLQSYGLQNDEVMYQLARKEVGAIIQSITYNEFLPALGIILTPYTGYGANVKPDIMNEFSTAAFRIGHTMVTDELLLMDDNCQPVRKPLNLEEAFFDISWINDLGLDPFLKGLSVQRQQKVDAKIVDGLRNFLFNIPRLPGVFGLDLAALNIQRGRDHGLQDYNTLRSYFTGNRAFFFSQINSDPTVWQPLAQLYDYDINNIDPWVGMLCEEHLPGSSVGPTMYYIIKSQFEKVRDGDYFYYQNEPLFTPIQKENISNTRLSDIIRNNTSLTAISDNVFKIPSNDCNTNGNMNYISCGKTTIEYGSGSIGITGATNKNYKFTIDRIAPTWENITTCMGRNCGSSIRLSNLSIGTYVVRTWADDWTIVCDERITLNQTTNNVAESTPPLAANIRTTNRLSNSILYPNPASTVVHLTLPESIHQEGLLLFFNSLGQQVKSQPISNISDTPITTDIQGLQSGIYQVQLLVNGVLESNHQLIINR